jgi:secondary thiamine-phosphate synthase enzyme
MKIHTEEFSVRTAHRDQMIGITPQVADALGRSGVTEGILVVHVPHTTAGVTVNENADPDVVHDVLGALDAAVPWKQGFYRHGEGNSAAHVKSSMVGCSQTLLVSAGRIVLGTWQGVYFCEFDGPRTRRAIVRVMGE